MSKQIKPDYDRIDALLDIVAKVASTAPGYTHIQSAAMAELKIINDEIKAVATANVGPPTDPLALKSVSEPEKGGIPSNELGAEPERVTLDDVGTDAKEDAIINRRV